MECDCGGFDRTYPFHPALMGETALFGGFSGFPHGSLRDFVLPLECKGGDPNDADGQITNGKTQPLTQGVNWDMGYIGSRRTWRPFVPLLPRGIASLSKSCSSLTLEANSDI
jgi:hypothetical protein